MSIRQDLSQPWSKGLWRGKGLTRVEICGIVAKKWIEMNELHCETVGKCATTKGSSKLNLREATVADSIAIGEVKEVVSSASAVNSACVRYTFAKYGELFVVLSLMRIPDSSVSHRARPFGRKGGNGPGYWNTELYRSCVMSAEVRVGEG
ncbi:hypothetical protein ZHAS_00011190 [Anopheles sinensis]|uniref:Uncharacterized protein n=1 Tax=Anopheles sinensis TaxID=74873 RepID=A0A084VZK0_ANOSI|nr:hypothetical protein ZHAS_00011190 [Anopheles sinensis]